MTLTDKEMGFIAKSFSDRITEQLKLHEGYRRFIYKCTSNKNTIAYGRNLTDKGISRKEAEYLLQNDILECLKDLEKIFLNTFGLMPINAQLVLTDMRFNLGSQGFRSFKKLIKFADRGDWRSVIKEMIDSRWYRQVGDRSKTLVDMIEDIE